MKKAAAPKPAALKGQTAKNGAPRPRAWKPAKTAPRTAPAKKTARKWPLDWRSVRQGGRRHAAASVIESAASGAHGPVRAPRVTLHLWPAVARPALGGRSFSGVYLHLWRRLKSCRVSVVARLRHAPELIKEIPEASRRDKRMQTFIRNSGPKPAPAPGSDGAPGRAGARDPPRAWWRWRRAAGGGWTMKCST